MNKWSTDRALSWTRSPVTSSKGSLHICATPTILPKPLPYNPISHLLEKTPRPQGDWPQGTLWVGSWLRSWLWSLPYTSTLCTALCVQGLPWSHSWNSHTWPFFCTCLNRENVLWATCGDQQLFRELRLVENSKNYTWLPLKFSLRTTQEG